MTYEQCMAAYYRQTEIKHTPTGRVGLITFKPVDGYAPTHFWDPESGDTKLLVNKEATPEYINPRDLEHFFRPPSHSLPPSASPQTWEKIADTLERIATALEKQS